MVDVWLPYGNTEVCLRVPAGNFLGMIRPKDIKEAENPQEEIKRSLEEPVGTKRLSEIAKPGDRVSIVMNCVDDPRLNLLILRSILGQLKEAGCGSEDIRVIRGYDPLSIDNARSSPESWKDEISKEAEVVDHNREAEDSVYLGETSFGTRVYLNRQFAESKVKVLAGLLEPHPYAGYSSGRDSVLPGVSGVETMQHNLSMVTDPKARPGLLEGNPVHQDMVEAARLVGVDFALNVVRNSERKTVRAFAGDLEKAFYEGVSFADAMYKIPVDGRADIVFVSPGGSAFDSSLYQSCKGINNTLDVAKKNGVFVLVAECLGGYGNAAFYESILKFKDLKRMESSLKKHFTAGGFMAYSLMRARERVEVILVSTLPDYYTFETLKLKTARTVNEAVRYAFDATKKNAKILAISHGSFTIPVVRE